MVVLLALLALAGPPRATLAAGTTHVPLAVSSWCWGTHCGAPIAASAKTLTVRRATVVHVQLAFEPLQAHLAVAGRPVQVAIHGRDLSWPARLAGGLSLNVAGPKGWITYVGRLRVRG